MLRSLKQLKSVTRASVTTGHLTGAHSQSQCLAAFSSRASARCYAGKESEPVDPKVIEKEKSRQLSGEGAKTDRIKSAPGWNETLSSESEAAVKAEKDDHHDSIEELQEHTAQIHKEEKQKD